LGGLDDPRVSRERLEGWANQTASRFEAHYFPGDHFFLNTARDAVLESIVAEL
jgi:medium-chain acyl-[acyl-carrier-protein] hydrolase